MWACTRHAKINKQVDWMITSDFFAPFSTTHFDRRMANAYTHGGYTNKILRFKLVRSLSFLTSEHTQSQSSRFEY